MDEDLAWDFGRFGFVSIQIIAPKSAASSLLELASAAPWHVGNGILFTSVLRAHPSRNSCGINPLLQCMGMSSLPATGWEWKSHQMSRKAGAQQLGVEAVTSVELPRAPRVKAALKGQEWLQWGSFPWGNAGQSLNHGIN